MFDTDNYGEVSVSFAMLEVDRNNLEEGIEIKGDDIEFTEIMGYYDVDDLTKSEVEDLIEKYEGNTLYDPDEDDYYTEEYEKGGKVDLKKFDKEIAEQIDILESMIKEEKDEGLRKELMEEIEKMKKVL